MSKKEIKKNKNNSGNIVIVIAVALALILFISGIVYVNNDYNYTQSHIPYEKMNITNGSNQIFRNALYYYNFTVNKTSTLIFNFVFVPEQNISMTYYLNGYFLINASQFNEITQVNYGNTPPNYVSLIGPETSLTLSPNIYTIVFVVYGNLEIHVQDFNIVPA